MLNEGLLDALFFFTHGLTPYHFTTASFSDLPEGQKEKMCVALTPEKFLPY